MDFGFTEQQEILKKFARDFLTIRYTNKVIKELESSTGHSPEIWNEMAELGWLGLPFPEEYGGAGMSFLDLCVLLEEMGWACMISPYLSNNVLGGMVIDNLGTEEQKKQYLAQIISGKSISSLALFEADARLKASAIKTVAKYNNGSWIINGKKCFVPYAQICDCLLCVATTGDRLPPENNIAIFLVDARSPGITIALHNTRAGKLCEIIMHDVQVGEENMLGVNNVGWELIEGIVNRANIAKCCEAVGSCEKVLQMSVDYARDRKQFGRPIGSFQAIQNYCAEMLTDIYGMRVTSYHTAWLITENTQCLTEIDAARIWCYQAIERIIHSAHQIHGAMGFTQDYNLHYYTSRLRSIQADIDINKLYSDVIATKIGF